jgi:hypothetical protein
MTIRLSATKTADAVEKIAESGHRISDGKQHADVVTNTAGSDVYNDFHIMCKCSALDMKVDESEKSAALSGSHTKHFAPTAVYLTVASTSGALNADGTINISTTTDGSDILAGIATTGLTAVGATRAYPITAQTHTVLADSTIYVNVESAETGAGTLTLDVVVVGTQV